MIFLSKVTIFWTLICKTAFKTTLQRFGLSENVIYVQPFIGNSRSKWSRTHFSFHIFIEKGGCHDFVKCDEFLGRMYQKWKMLTFCHIFAYYSNEFYCKMPYLIMLGHILHFKYISLSLKRSVNVTKIWIFDATN